MFQTEIILYLQSLATDGLTAFMNTITSLGDDKVQAFILLLIPFGISYRKGVLLVQIFMWIGLTTDSLKAIFSLPRPTYVNANIQNLQHGDSDVTPFSSAGAESFFGSMDTDVVEAFRESNNDRYGMPSGHVSSTVALWGGIALLFDKWILHWLAAMLIILVAISRMYLGRHFLGDVLGGILVGAAILLVVQFAMKRWDWFVQSINSTKVYLRSLNLLKYLFWFVLPLITAVVFPESVGKSAGYLVGINGAALLIARHGEPDDAGSLWKRGARVLLAVLLYFAAYGIFELFLEITGLEDVHLVEDVLEAMVLMFVSVYGTVRLSLKLGLYETTKPEIKVMETNQMRV